MTPTASFKLLFATMPAQQGSIELARHASAQTYQPFAVVFEQFLINAWLEVKSLQVSGLTRAA